MPDVASMVVGAAGALQCAGGCVGPAHSGVRGSLDGCSPVTVS